MKQRRMPDCEGQRLMPDCRLSKWLMPYLESGEKETEGGEGKRTTMPAEDEGRRGLLQRMTTVAAGGMTTTAAEEDGGG